MRLDHVNYPTCRWPECESMTLLARKMCRKHYLRAYKMGNFVDPWDHYLPYGVPAEVPPCKWPGCDRLSKYVGFCSRDYSRAKALGNYVDPWTEWVTDGTCEVCGKTWTGARNRNKRVCSNTCSAKAWARENPERHRANKMDAVRRRRARIAGVEVEHFTVQDIRMAHGDDCYLCGKPINYRLKFPHPMSPSVDHIMPISAGGPHSLSNCAMTHMGCNNKKNAGEATAVPVRTLFAT